MNRTKPHDRAFHFLFTSVLLAAGMVIFAAAGWCQEEPDNDLPDDEPAVAAPKEQQAAVYTGYRFITPVDAPLTIAPYLRRKSGVVGGFSLGVIDGDLKLAAEGQFLHADDYHTGLYLDYAGLYRLRLDTATLWHNLDRQPLPAGWALPFDSMTPRFLETAGEYGIRTNISQIDNRFKLGNHPIHFNISYWELSRLGTTQARFSDHAFDGTPASIIAQSNRTDTTTRELSTGIDAYLGPVSVAYSFAFRDFSNNNAAPVYGFFSARDGFAGGALAHDAASDSRVLTNTFTLASDLSGGLTANALYSLTRRESSADGGDTRPSSAPADMLQAVAGDISYTPFKELSFAVKYRHLDIDRETPSSVYSPYYQLPATPSPVFTAIPGLLLVRPSSDTSRDTLTLSASWRPVPKALYRLEYKADLESRSNLPDPLNLTAPSALRSDTRQTHTATASFLWRPLNAVRFNAVYSYATCDNPAYLASFAERHTGQAQISYSNGGRWGLTANYLGAFESGSNSSNSVRLPRDSARTAVGSSLWFNPLARLTVTTGYSFFQTAIDQHSLISDQFPSPLLFSLVNAYRSQAHSYTVDAVYAANDALDLSVSFQQIFSDNRFSATDNSTNPSLSAAGIGDAARLVSTETGLTARADWRQNRTWGYSLAYSFKHLASHNALNGGSLHETMLALTGRW